MTTTRRFEPALGAGPLVTDYSGWEAVVSAERRLLRRTRRILILLMTVFLFSFFGARIAGQLFDEAHVMRAVFGIGAALSFLLGSLLVIFGVHRAPRVASVIVLLAGALLAVSEITKAVITLGQMKDYPAAVLMFGLADQGYYVGIIIAVGALNLALFEMCARKMELIRQHERVLFAKHREEMSEKRYRAVFDGASDGIMILSGDGTVVEINASACRFVGRDREGLLGANVADLMDAATARRVLQWSDGTPSPGVDITEAEFRQQDGSSATVELRVSSLPQGEVLLLGRDTSERKRLEEQLRQAQKMESIGRIAGGVAHDFNNALTPILGYTELILETMSADARHREELTQILRAAQHARDLTRQLLAFGRKQVLEIKAIDLNQVVSDFRDVLRRTIRENIAIELRLSPESGRIRADRLQVEQILMNLAVNAQESMPDGGTIVIETTHVDLDEASLAQSHPGAQSGPHVGLIVSDTGMGMDRDTLKQVFEPFFTTKGRGTGLGLATVYGIVKQHGGAIWMYSEPGTGTTCKAYFPSSNEPASPPGPRPALRPRGKRDETILLVEDNEAVRKLVRAILESCGYAVRDTGSPVQALELVDRDGVTVDLLLTDVVMPEMNGKELYTRLSERLPCLRVLYMSGYTADIIAVHGVLEQDIDFIQKPISTEALSLRVQEVLGR
ncbi:MAG: response regulator [FCB group bacterium]|jgi:PAS domain S-box-containing protein|nr:response regulator [FCB group bacterium]